MPGFEKNRWEALLAAERPSWSRRLWRSVLISAAGFLVTYLLHWQTGFYFTSVILISVILVSFTSGGALGVAAAVVLDLADDYFFIPPIGTVLDSSLGIEHLLILTAIGAFVAFLGSSLRSAVVRSVLARQEAERASDLMEKVLALVSHDIRNPLTVIGTGAQLLQRGSAQTETQQAILAQMMQSIAQVDSMIQSLLDAVRMRTGRGLPLKFRACDLNAELAAAVESASRLEGDRITYSAGEPAPGMWGVDGIRRAVQNLVHNAVKYGDPGTPIEVRLLRKGERVRLSVHNEGPEIPAEDQAGLFEAFQRTRRSEAGDVKGWGLGLALVKGVAEAHGGEVRVESGQGRGTTFTLDLPIREAEQEPARPQPGLRTASTGERGGNSRLTSG